LQAKHCLPHRLRLNRKGIGGILGKVRVTLKSKGFLLCPITGTVLQIWYMPVTPTIISRSCQERFCSVVVVHWPPTTWCRWWLAHPPAVKVVPFAVFAWLAKQLAALPHPLRYRKGNRWYFGKSDHIKSKGSCFVVSYTVPFCNMVQTPVTQHYP